MGKLLSIEWQKRELSTFMIGVLLMLSPTLRGKNLPTDAMEALVEHYTYESKVFITPPWEDIFTTDDERKEDFETMSEIHQILHTSYKEFGYEVIELPKISPAERVNFILEQLGIE